MRHPELDSGSPEFSERKSRGHHKAESASREVRDTSKLYMPEISTKAEIREILNQVQDDA